MLKIMQPGAFAGAFELLTTGLRLNGGGRVRVVAVSAPRVKDGSSTIAANLAITVAGTGRKVLLVDANLRAPVLHRAFDVSEQPGLADVMTGGAAIDDSIRKTIHDNLWILPAGTMAGSPHARLESHDLDAIFDRLRSRFDFIVIDTPALLAYSDALQVSRVSDGTILVLPERAPRRGVLEAKRRLDRVQASVLGIVLNRIDPRMAATI